MNFLFEHPILCIPPMLNVVAILLYRGIFRYYAILLLIPIGSAAAFDFYSLSQNGNLTGIATILVSGPSVLVLFILGVINLFSRVTRSRHQSNISDEDLSA